MPAPTGAPVSGSSVTGGRGLVVRSGRIGGSGFVGGRGRDRRLPLLLRGLDRVVAADLDVGRGVLAGLHDGGRVGDRVALSRLALEVQGVLELLAALVPRHPTDLARVEQVVGHRDGPVLDLVELEGRLRGVLELVVAPVHADGVAPVVRRLLREAAGVAEAAGLACPDQEVLGLVEGTARALTEVRYGGQPDRHVLELVRVGHRQRARHLPARVDEALLGHTHGVADRAGLALVEVEPGAVGHLGDAPLVGPVVGALGRVGDDEIAPVAHRHGRLVRLLGLADRRRVGEVHAAVLRALVREGVGERPVRLRRVPGRQAERHRRSRRVGLVVDDRDGLVALLVHLEAHLRLRRRGA